MNDKKPSRSRRVAQPKSAQETTATPAPRPARTAPRTVKVLGIVKIHPRGFGFLTPAADQPMNEDVFLPGHLLKGILDSDEVFVEVRPGETQARHVRLHRRTREWFIGSVNEDGTSVQIDPGVGLDSLPLTGRAAPGSVVRCRLQGTKAQILERLGTDSDPNAQLRRFLDRYRLPHDRPDQAERAATGRFRLGPLTHRADLRDQLVITIDDDSSRDLDDALAARLEQDGSVRIWVHIADVAEHVRPGTPIDFAAREVPTSVYLPQGVRHMLPEAFAADRLSLIPGVERDTLCAEFRVDPQGEVRGVDIYQARIRSRRRLSYATVARVLEGRNVDLPEEILDLLRVLRAATSRLDLVRSARGGLDSMRVDQDRASSASEERAHQLIERLMVATNEAVASWLSDRGMPALWRAHDPISGPQVEELERVANGFGVIAGLVSPVSPRALAAAAAQVPQGHAGSAFWDALLGVLGRAYYTVEPNGHFGLGSSGYLHFTSPLRRYPDLLVHRVVKGYLAGDRDPGSYLPALVPAAAAANDVFRRAAMAERDATLALALGEVATGQEFQAIAVGRAKSGTRVRLESPGVTATISGNIRPGERITVKVLKVDPAAGKIELKRLDRSGETDTRRRDPQPDNRGTAEQRPPRPATAKKTSSSEGAKKPRRRRRQSAPRA